MAVEFYEAQPPATAEAIEGVESALGITLAADYEAFLCEHNGGYLEPNFLPPEGDASLHYLYSAGPNDDEDLDDLEQAAWFFSPEGDSDPDIPAGYLPIGGNEGGDIICLKVEGDDAGAVYFWTHDTAVGDDPLERLGDSFGTFISALRPADELDID